MNQFFRTNLVSFFQFLLSIFLRIFVFCFRQKIYCSRSFLLSHFKQLLQQELINVIKLTVGRLTVSEPCLSSAEGSVGAEGK